jgi:hypothetical protein
MGAGVMSVGGREKEVEGVGSVEGEETAGGVLLVVGRGDGGEASIYSAIHQHNPRAVVIVAHSAGSREGRSVLVHERRPDFHWRRNRGMRVMWKRYSLDHVMTAQARSSFDTSKQAIAVLRGPTVAVAMPCPYHTLTAPLPYHYGTPDDLTCESIPIIKCRSAVYLPVTPSVLPSAAAPPFAAPSSPSLDPER